MRAMTSGEATPPRDSRYGPRRCTLEHDIRRSRRFARFGRGLLPKIDDRAGATRADEAIATLEMTMEAVIELEPPAGRRRDDQELGPPGAQRLQVLDGLAASAGMMACV